MDACGQLQSGVDVKAVLIALMNRLAAFAKAEPGSIPPDVNMLDVFNRYDHSPPRQGVGRLHGESFVCHSVACLEGESFVCNSVYSDGYAFVLALARRQQTNKQTDTKTHVHTHMSGKESHQSSGSFGSAKPPFQNESTRRCPAQGRSCSSKSYQDCAQIRMSVMG